MKKIISGILVCMLIACMVFTLASCAGIDDGKYAGTNGSVIEISGENMVLTEKDGTVTEYTFEIKDNENDSDKKDICLTVTSGDSKGKEFSLVFEEREDDFVIDGILYKKQ